jgi:hypothetical protein
VAFPTPGDELNRPAQGRTPAQSTIMDDKERLEDELREAARRIQELDDERELTELRKLPQARMYFEAAQWGFDELLTKKLQGRAFQLYLIGILASLRAVQHSLRDHDSKLSDEHKRVVDEWWKATPLSTPELDFIRTSRDLLLKRGTFNSYAIVSESSIGEGPNREITSTGYELAYYDEAGKRHDLEEAIRGAINWCDRELTAIEKKLPP